MSDSNEKHVHIHGDAEVHIHFDGGLVGDPVKQAKRVIDVFNAQTGKHFTMPLIGDPPVATQTVTLDERVENAYAHLRARLIQGDLILTNKYFDRDDTYNVEEYIKKVLREILENE